MDSPASAKMPEYSKVVKRKIIATGKIDTVFL